MSLGLSTPFNVTMETSTPTRSRLSRDSNSFIITFCWTINKLQAYLRLEHTVGCLEVQSRGSGDEQRLRRDQDPCVFKGSILGFPHWLSLSQEALLPLLISNIILIDLSYTYGLRPNNVFFILNRMEIFDCWAPCPGICSGRRENTQTGMSSHCLLLYSYAFVAIII